MGMGKSKIVKSPAGDEIELLSDAEWVELTGATRQSMSMWNASKRPVFGALWKHGAFTDPNGGASTRLMEAAWKLGMEGGKRSGSPTGALFSLISNPAVAPAIERDINGKRCYSIRLVALPQTWYERLATDFPATNGHKAPAASDVPSDVPSAVVNGTKAPAPEPSSDDREAAETVAALVMPPDDAVPALPPSDEPVPDFGPPVDLQIASSVAMALLTQVVEIISSGTPDHGKIRKLETDLADVADKLSRRLSENDAMRKSIRELGEENHALRHERDGLRQRLRMTEANLEKATNLDTQRITNERVQAELAKVMRATPVGPSSHGKD